MIDLTTILTILLLIVVFVIVWKIFKSLLKAAVTVSILVLVLIGLLTGIVYLDYQDLRSTLNEEAKIVIVDDQEILTEIGLSGFDEARLINVTNESLYLEIDYDFIVSSNITLAELNVSLTEEEFKRILSSNNMEEITSIIAENQGLPQLIVSNQLSSYEADEIKTMLTLVALNNKIREDKHLAIIEGVKEEQIRIEPEFTSIKIINALPNFIVERWLR